MSPTTVFRGQLILPDRIERGAVIVREGLIAEVLEGNATLQTIQDDLKGAARSRLRRSRPL